VNIANSFYPVCVRGTNPYTRGAPDVSQTETAFHTREGTPITLQWPSALDNPDLKEFHLCGHSSVLRFVAPRQSGDDGALGDVGNRWPMVTPNVSGWGRIQVPGLNGQGLPIIGFAASELYNSAVAPGTAGVFGQTFPLTTTRP
jgi:hypothetical protein